MASPKVLASVNLLVLRVSWRLPLTHYSSQTPTTADLERVVAASRELIETGFGGEPDYGGAAVLLGAGSILTGTSPDFPNPSTTVCHETEPYLAAFRLNQPILASLCLHRTEDDYFVALSPCGICQERLMMHGPDPFVGVPEHEDSTQVRWIRLDKMMPYYWQRVFD